LHPATPDDANVRACMSGEASPTHVGPLTDQSYMDKSILTSTPSDEVNAESPPSPIFNPEDLIGRTFLMDEQEDGQKFRGRIVELIEDHLSLSWKIIPPGLSSESLSMSTKLKKLSLTTKC
jgi:hypothetical protein